MKGILILIAILSLFNGCMSRPETTHTYSTEDSVFLFTMFLNYDEQSKTFGDVDEPTVYDFWNESREEAIQKFRIEAKMKSVPPAQRMVFASYLSYIGVDQPVLDILSGIKDEDEITDVYYIDVYYIMDSYGVSFKKFEVSETMLKKNCPDIAYH